MKNNFHIFRINDKLNMQNYFLFVDTETKSLKTQEQEELSFRLACSVFWNKKLDITNRRQWLSINDFWNYAEDIFMTHKQTIFFAHNMDMDFRILDGFNELEKRGWKLTNSYIKQSVFMLEWKKKDKNYEHIIYVWDTTNYGSVTLKQLGESMNIPKFEIDFKTADNNELLAYCMRDVEIIYHYIVDLVRFLEEAHLSKLMPTSASLSLNIFRHSFYDRKNNPIGIHDWKQVIKLERKAYHGGMTECFQLGKIGEKVYKLDINSMYPFIMRNNDMPSILLDWYHQGLHSKEKLMELYNNHKDKHLIIAKCLISITPEYAFLYKQIKKDGTERATRVYGEFETVLTSPELTFVEKYGKIIEIFELAIYRRANLFKEFVDYFYEKRQSYKHNHNRVNDGFCKLIMNSLYGKWGQKQITQRELTKEEIKRFLDDFSLNPDTLSSCTHVLDGIKDEQYDVIKLGNTYMRTEKSEDNSKDAFVAIASLITGYARMMLTEYILRAGAENVFYCDTDSLFVNKNGYDNLVSVIDNNKLGFLKVEDVSDNTIIFNLKDYTFKGERKTKGIKHNAEVIDENELETVFQQDQWERFHTALKRGHLNKQIIKQVIKRVSKTYNKGNVLPNGKVIPYSINEVDL